MRRNNALFVLGLYLFLYFAWGSTYFFIKMGLETMPAMLLVSGRWTIGGLLFLLYGLAVKGKAVLPGRREAWSALVMAVLLILIPNGLLTVAERKIDSYLAALLVATMPFAVAFFDRVFFGKKVKTVTIAGMVLGVLGVAALVYDGRSIAASFSPELLMMAGLVISWSIGTSVGAPMKKHDDPVIHTGWQMLFAGLLCALITAVLRPGELVPSAALSGRSVFGLLYLVGPGALGYAAFNYLLEREPTVRLSSYTLVNPVIAVLLGLLLGHETPVRYIMIGVPVILSGLFLMMYGEPVAAWLRSRGEGVKQVIEGAPANE